MAQNLKGMQRRGEDTQFGFRVRLEAEMYYSAYIHLRYVVICTWIHIFALLPGERL